MTTADTLHLAAAAIRDCCDNDPTLQITAAWFDSCASRLDRDVDYDYAVAMARSFIEVTA